MNLLPQYAAEGRITRHSWSRKGDDGQELLCLYTAIAGNRRARPDRCPKRLMPQWLAHVLPRCDDDGSEEAWPTMVRRWAAVSDRLGLLVGERGDRLRSRWLATVLRGMPAEPSRDAVIALLDRHGSGGDVADYEWMLAMNGAVWEWPEWYAAAAAGDAVYSAAAATEAAWSVADYFRSAPAYESAWDRMTDSLLTLIEREVTP